MLQCPKCNHDNELGRIFCIKCGEKLDISKVAPPSGVVRRAKSGKKQISTSKVVETAFLKSIKVALLALVMAFLTAGLLPPDIQRRSCSPQNYEAYHTKRTELDEGTLNESGVSVVFDEGDFNATLTQLVKKQQETGASKLPVKLESIYISLQDGSVLITSQNKWKYFSLYAQIEVKPVPKNDNISFRLVGAHIGRLRIPPEATPLMNRIQQTFQMFFSGCEAERMILEKVNSVVIKPGQVIVSTTKKE